MARKETESIVAEAPSWLDGTEKLGHSDPRKKGMTMKSNDVLTRLDYIAQTEQLYLVIDEPALASISKELATSLLAYDHPAPEIAPDYEILEHLAGKAPGNVMMRSDGENAALYIRVDTPEFDLLVNTTGLMGGTVLMDEDSIKYIDEHPNGPSLAETTYTKVIPPMNAAQRIFDMHVPEPERRIEMGF